ncbi:MAG: TMEM175 family protein [Vicinamibacterales bacterium]
MVKRSHQVTRLEGFSDAVFGFALTLLVVQLEVPRTSDALLNLVRGSLPFAVTFAMVCYIWWEHNKFFRRYGLQDAWTAFLNSMLLFVVLFYVYPLKFLATALLGPLVGLSDVPRGWNGRFVMLTYSFGVLFIFGIFVLLYHHARSRRVELGLGPADLITLHFNLRAHMMSATLGLTSVILAFLVPSRDMWLPGVLYGLMGPLHTWNGFRKHGALQTLEKEALRTRTADRREEGREE